MNLLLAVVFAGALALAQRAGRSATWDPARFADALNARWSPLVFGLLTSAIVRLVWRSFDQPGIFHDERAYLLQADIFARGRWTASAPPLAAFFEQVHVFVEPSVFAKYPPAHAMMLAPGMLLRMPGLMPALLAGAAGALTFWLARRVSNEWTAFVTWLLWTTAPITLFWSASYMSETTTTVMWLAAASATALWLESGKPRYLVGAAAALAWGFDARPLTMVALAAPLAAIILRSHVQRGGWRALAAPLLVALAVMSVYAFWNRQTLGRWTSDPYAAYSRTYFPYDKPGFGVDSTPALRPLPPEFAPLAASVRELHDQYQPSTVPLAFAQRVAGVLMWYGAGWRLAIAALLLASLVRARGAARFTAAASACLVAAYLVFAHPPDWTVYYVELLPGLHFLAAGALVDLFARSNGTPFTAAARVPAAVARSAALAAALLVPFCVVDVARARTMIDVRNEFHRRAEATIRSAPANSILFVRYPASQSPHLAVTRNEADLAGTRSWIVHDRGAENARLLSVAPERRGYVLDLSAFRLEPLADGRIVNR